MIAQQSVTSAISRLDQAIASGQLPPPSAELAARISRRLSNPVRVAVLGLPGSGKSKILNFLAGSMVIPENIKLPSVMVVWGEVPKTICTLQDGSTLTFGSFDKDEVGALDPVFLQLELPLPALKKISFLEVAMGTSEEEQKKALAWAAPEIDIALWCTQSFSQHEMALWDVMPETLQDHSFMILTKADLPEIQANMVEWMSNLSDIAADRFRSVFPMQTLQAISARDADGKVNKGQLTASGGRALIGAILRTVDQGTQASLDGADILFSQFDIADAEIATPEVAPDDDMAAMPDDPGENRNGFQGEAISYLTGRARELRDQLAGSEPPDSDQVMERCLEDGEWLLDQLSELAADDPGLDSALHNCQNAVDLMLLLQLEQQDSAVEDAVALLLQMKRGFAQQLAA